MPKTEKSKNIVDCVVAQHILTAYNYYTVVNVKEIKAVYRIELAFSISDSYPVLEVFEFVALCFMQRWGHVLPKLSWQLSGRHRFNLVSYLSIT